MTLLVAAMGGALMLLQRGSLERTRLSGEKLYESVGEVYAATEEHLLNLKSVKTYNNEDRDVRLFGELCEEVARHTRARRDSRRHRTSWFEAGSLAALGVVVFLALRVLHVQAATMLLLLAIFTRLMPQLASLQSQIHQIASVLPSYDHVLAIEAECAANAEARGDRGRFRRGGCAEAAARAAAGGCVVCVSEFGARSASRGSFCAGSI